MSPELQQTLAVAEWVLDEADVAFAAQDWERAARCTRLASHVLSRQNHWLRHARVERNIQRLGAHVAGPAADGAACTGQGCLHVFTRAMGHGGHTAMPVRWINGDSRPGPHHAALLAQDGDPPFALREAVIRRGGRLFQPPPGLTPLQVSRWLRDLARQEADRVVLHVDTDDIVATAAFGAPAGPPVMIVNHAAHIFWAGASVADVIVNVQGSPIQIDLIRRYRLAPQVIVPIPLSEVEAPGDLVGTRARAKTALGIAPEALVILTSGDSYKYAAVPPLQLDFVAEAQAMLPRLPAGTHVIAIGVKEDARWAAASAATGGRVRALGRQSDVAPFYDAADLYIEGFPFGSTTALLEAGLRAIPTVVAPAVCPSPFTSDGVALDEVVTRTPTMAAYVTEIVRLAGDRDARRALGQALQSAVRRHHLGAGWNEYLARADAQVPRQHDVRSVADAEPTPSIFCEYWTAFRERCWRVDWSDLPAEELVERYLVALIGAGARPRISRALRRQSEPLRARRREALTPMAGLWLAAVAARRRASNRQAVAVAEDVRTLFRAGSRTRRWFTAVAPAFLW